LGCRCLILMRGAVRSAVRAQPNGYRIRREDEKNTSAILMRILQTCR
jgi:hypothetical protein